MQVEKNMVHETETGAVMKGLNLNKRNLANAAATIRTL